MALRSKRRASSKMERTRLGSAGRGGGLHRRRTIILTLTSPKVTALGEIIMDSF